MYTRPAVLGIDVHSPKVVTDIGAARTLQDVGSNTGNIIFSEALYRTLRSARRLTYHFDVASLRECDVVVIAAANWINGYSDFGEVAKRLKATGLPVVICGIGAQLDHHGARPRVTEGTRQLLHLAAETSGQISCRGDFSHELLQTLGFRDAVATGCPSLLLAGSDGVRLRPMARLNSTEQLVLQSTRHLYTPCENDVQRYLYRQAYRLRADVLLQSELVDMHAAVREIEEPERRAVAERVLAGAYGCSAGNARRYLHAHGKTFVQLEDWLNYLRKKDFCLGTRIHGTVAALLSGTPAALITHDSRTEELAQSMNIPCFAATELDIRAPLDVGSFHDQSQLRRFETGYQCYRERFIEFFNAAGLAFDEGYSGLATESAAVSPAVLEP